MPSNEPWWIGGVSGAVAGIATHPLDSIKVRMQTAPQGLSVAALLADIARKEQGGLFALFRGVDASILRQLTYSSARFAVYDHANTMLRGSALALFSPLLSRIVAASIGGVCGGLVGSPADLVNVRMQIDGKLPPAERRNYKNALDGLIRITRDEGFFALFHGVQANVFRAIFMTAGQIATYDSIKEFLIAPTIMNIPDGFFVHFVASACGAFVATTLCSPIDVIKSRLMAQSAKNPEFLGAADAAAKIYRREGWMAFFKGWTPAFIRLGPHTVLTFVILEYLKSVWAVYSVHADAYFAALTPARVAVLLCYAYFFYLFGVNVGGYFGGNRSATVENVEETERRG